MSRIFITGSADGLGQMVAKLLLADGHQVVLHARNRRRADEAMAKNPSAEAALVGDLASIRQTTDLANEVNKLGSFDVIIHNAAVGYREPQKIVTEDNLSQLFAINSLAPYLLTALINRPKRLIYLSSGLHRGGDESLEDLQWEHRRWNGYQAYSDSKLHDVILAFAIGNLWKDVHSNALEPGWVATKMGGAGAPDSLADAPMTQVWLATSNDQVVLSSGGYFYHMAPREVHPAARREDIQQLFLEKCHAYSGVRIPS